MAQITVDIKDDKIGELQDAIASLNGYQEQVLDPDDETLTIDNPESKTDFVGKIIKQYLQNQFIEYKNRQALSNAATEDNDL